MKGIRTRNQTKTLTQLGHELVSWDTGRSLIEQLAARP